MVVYDLSLLQRRCRRRQGKNLLRQCLGWEVYELLLTCHMHDDLGSVNGCRRAWGVGVGEWLLAGVSVREATSLLAFAPADLLL